MFENHPKHEGLLQKCPKTSEQIKIDSETSPGLKLKMKVPKKVVSCENFSGHS
jgi:hypothetical protein